MVRMVWEGENLEKLKKLNYLTGDRPKFNQAAKELFPNLTTSQVRIAVHNARRRGRIPKYNEIADTVLERAEPVDEVEYEYQTQADRKIVRLETEVRRLRKLYKEQTKDVSGNDAIIAAIREVLPELQPVEVPSPLKVNGHVEEEELVLLLSDLHFGEVVDEDETGGISSFNLDIAKRRFDFTIEKAITIAKEKQKGYHYGKLNVFMLGDLISGLIHDELKEHDEVAVVQQMLYAIEVISAGLLRLCQEFEQVHVCSVVGNHGRVKEAYYFKGKANNNFDFLVSKMLEKLTASQPNLTWNVPESFWAIEEVAGQRFMLSHGDYVRSWNQVPFYGLNRAYMKWRVLCADYGISFDHQLVGHFHQVAMFTAVRGLMIMNGSIKGGDEYSIGAISAACDPEQVLFAVNPNRYGITAFWKLNSGHIR